MADEARLNELLDLVEQARKEGDKETEAKATAAYKRESAPPVPAQDPAQFGGAGGFNPMLPRLAGASQAFGNELGVTPENSANPTANAVGPLEMLAQGGTGLLGMIGGGLAGIGQGLWNTVTPESMNGMPAGDRVRQIEGAVTYRPRTGTGAGFTRAAGAPQEALSKYISTPAGEKVTDLTGSPLAGALVKTSFDVAPAVLSRGRTAEAGPSMRGKYISPRDAVPTIEQLSKAATDAYKRADEAGITVSEQSFNGMKSKLADALNKQGIDPTLHPNATAALKRITEETGPVSLQKLETLRRVALDAEDTLVKADAKKAGDIVDTIDEYVDNLSDSELTSGKAKDAAALKEARALYTRKRKAEDIDRLIRRAEYSPSGFENGLRIEFRALAKNDRRFNRFNAEEKAAIDRVAKGGALENTLRLLGKAAPTGIVSGGLGVAGGAAIAGPAGAALVPAIGIAGRLGAKALTNRNARAAAETMRRGPLAQMQPPREQSRGLLAPPFPDALTFTPTPGLMPAKAASMSHGLDFPPAQVANPQVLPNAPMRGLTISAPQVQQGGLPFKNYLQADSGGLSLQPPAPQYPGGLDFVPTPLSQNVAAKMAGPLGLLEEIPATPAKGRMGLLDLPQKTRSVKHIQSEIRSLSGRIRTELADEPASSPKLQQALSELQALQRELEASQANR